MKKFLLAAAFAFIGSWVFAKDTLAVLPFSGAQGDDGETIAELFMFDPTINEAFSLIPRTSITRAMRREQTFQLSGGMTDPDKAVSISKELGAKYVIAGNIMRLGSQNLLVIGIINTETLEQIAGDIQTFGKIGEMPAKLPAMARNIVAATQRDSSKLPKLVTTQIVISGSDETGDILAQILTIYLVQQGNYAVYPRTKSLEQVQDEWDHQLSGHTADLNIVRMRAGVNPHLVLSVIARKLEGINMFNASIIDLLTGTQVIGRSVEYQNINDGMKIMETLAVALTSTTEEIAQRQQLEEEQREIDRIAAEKKERWEEYLSYATRNYFDFFLGGYFQWGDDLIYGNFYLFGGHFSPLPFMSIGLEGRGGPFFYLIDSPYGSAALTLGLVFPFTETVKIFADGMLEMGHFGGLKGMLADWVTPGFDAGILFLFDYTLFDFGFDIKYRGTWYDGLYTHSVGIGLIVAPFK